MRALVPLIALLLSGCSGGHGDAVRQTADEWSKAVRSGDWPVACDLLAPATLEELEKSAKKPCTEALPDEATEPSGDQPQVSAYGKSGQATWGDETVFLGDFGGRWLVWAATCTPAGADRPYDCDISGG